MTRTPTYNVWMCMNQRCRNPKNTAYPDYGGRGITVCERWLDFANFLEDMGVKPPGLTLERLRGEEGYSKENCVWATRTAQNRNRRNNVVIELDGKKMTMAEWSREVGIAPRTLAHRLKLGWSAEKTLRTPPTTNATRKQLI
ncbi:hypothetical protein [Paraburkholderia sp.]|uniref:hypothetical protein n=1 Tax=Paraburkholderia sp. TaxID=1926495 RepID=UPI0039E4FCEF